MRLPSENEHYEVHMSHLTSNLLCYYRSNSYHTINRNKKLNYNVNNINFKLLNFELLNLESIIFHEISININDPDSFNFNDLNDKIQLIIFVECVININTIKKLHENCHIYFYKCEIISIIGLYNTNITIKIIDTKTDNILDHIFLKRATIENKYIDQSYIIIS